MPIETLDDIAEEMADKLGVYGTCDDVDGSKDCSLTCNCRIGFVIDLKQRMIDAAKVERKLGDKP